MDEVALEAQFAAMLAGDEGGFLAVYTDLQPRLLRYVTVLVGHGDSEDIVSETWVHAVRDLSRFSGDLDGFRGWITRIARNRSMDHLRAAGRRPSVAADVSDLLADVAAPGDASSGTDESLSTQAAVALISTLPTEQAEAVMLRAVMGLDAKSAGAVLGRRPGAVRTAAHRGLKSLAAALDRPGNTFARPGAEEM
ncbi:MAG: RNA polymerase sigma factor [Nocardioides sp.]|uniref:RNA polymerase sigma factor n=1 Tax=Nocardioides sp. TaxID=35761 RepID=UPI003EFCB925